MKISKDEIEYTIDIVATEDIKGKFITVFYIGRDIYIHKALVHVENGEVTTERVEELIRSLADSWIDDYEDTHKYIPSWKKENKLYRCK